VAVGGAGLSALWPSFNVIDLEGDSLRAQSVAFPPEVDRQVWRRRRGHRGR